MWPKSASKIHLLKITPFGLLLIFTQITASFVLSAYITLKRTRIQRIYSKVSENNPALGVNCMELGSNDMKVNMRVVLA